MVTRGNVIIAVFGGGTGNKPRPAIIVQSPDFAGSITMLAIPLTSDLIGASVGRPIFEHSRTNGLKQTSCLMTDKMTPLRRDMIGDIIGKFSPIEMIKVEQSMLIMLGMVQA